MGNHIPGKPDFIVQSMPGAGGLLATNYLYAQAPQDGTTIGLIHSTVPLAPLFGMAGARFDPLKIHWLGSMDRSDGPCTAWHTSPIKTWSDMLDKEFIVGSSGVGSQMELYPVVMNKLFGTKMKVIGGYKDGSLDLPGDGARGDARALRPAAHLDRRAAPAMADREEDRGADRGQRAAHAAVPGRADAASSSPRTSRRASRSGC